MFSINTNKKSKYLMAVILVLCVMLLSIANAATNLANATVELYSDSGLTKKVTNSTYTYDTKAKKPYVKVTVDGAVVPSSQYEIEYLNNTIANDNLSEEYWAHVKVTGDGTNTIGYAYASFVINRLDLFSSNIEFEITGSKVYDGKITRPKVTKSRLKTSDGSYVDLGWTALKFDGTDAGVGGFDEVSCVNLLNVGFYHVWAFGTNYKTTLKDGYLYSQSH